MRRDVLRGSSHLDFLPPPAPFSSLVRFVEFQVPQSSDQLVSIGQYSTITTVLVTEKSPVEPSNSISQWLASSHPTIGSEFLPTGTSLQMLIDMCIPYGSPVRACLYSYG